MASGAEEAAVVIVTFFFVAERGSWLRALQEARAMGGSVRPPTPPGTPAQGPPSRAAPPAPPAHIAGAPRLFTEQGRQEAGRPGWGGGGEPYGNVWRENRRCIIRVFPSLSLSLSFPQPLNKSTQPLAIR